MARSLDNSQQVAWDMAQLSIGDAAGMCAVKQALLVPRAASIVCSRMLVRTPPAIFMSELQPCALAPCQCVMHAAMQVVCGELHSNL